MTDRRADQPDARMFAHLLYAVGINPHGGRHQACSICGKSMDVFDSCPIESPRIAGAREHLCKRHYRDVLKAYDALAAADDEPTPCTGAGGHIFRADCVGAPCARIACDVRRGDRA